MLKLKFIPLIISSILIWNSSVFSISFTSEVFYVVIILISVIKLISNKFFENFNWIFFWFLFFISLSILFNEIDPIFQSEIRFLAFLLINLLIGPFTSTKKLLFFRLNVFKYINYFFIAFSSLSYFFLVTGIYTGSKVRGEYFERVDFTGLFSHSMILSPVSALSMITLVHILLNKSISTTNKFFCFILFILCFLSLISSGSRIALIAGLIAILVLLFKHFKKAHIIAFKYIIPSLILLFSTFNLWSNNLDFLIDKFSSFNDNMVYSRSSLWDQRLLEFESSPFIGIGFAAVDEIYSQTGEIEPGSSWLALLSMTGIFGLFSFLILIGSIIFKFRESAYNNYLIAYFLFFMIHFIAEGYIFASGSLLFFCFWLLLGILFGIKKHYKSIIFNYDN